MEEDLRTTISRLRSQGLTNNQIIQTLQHQGHVPAEISYAMQALDRTSPYFTPSDKEGVQPMQQPQNPMKFQPQSVARPQQQSQQRMPPPPQWQQQQNQSAPNTNAPPNMPPPGMAPPFGMPQQNTQDADTDEIEELIEAVIEEKWNELRKSIDKLLIWKEKIDARMEQIGQQHKDLQNSVSQ